ncbi:MAG: hypothetical protein WC070_01400 [Candidatus Magasanikbacteria bacterium]
MSERSPSYDWIRQEGKQEPITSEGFVHIRNDRSSTETDEIAETGFNLHEEATFKLLEENPRRCLHFIKDIIERGHIIPETRMQKLIQAVANDKTGVAAQELYVLLTMHEYDGNLDVLWNRILKQPRVATNLLFSLISVDKLSDIQIKTLLEAIYNSSNFAENIIYLCSNPNIEILKKIFNIHSPKLSTNWKNAGDVIVEELGKFKKTEAVRLLGADGKLSIADNVGQGELILVPKVEELEIEEKQEVVGLWGRVKSIFPRKKAKK